MRKVTKPLISVALVSALGVGGCDLNPEYPVLDGHEGPSSRSPSHEAFAATDEGDAASSEHGTAKHD